METAAEMEREDVGLVGRMIRVFFAPGETFAAVAHRHGRADWFVPMALVAVLGTVAAFVVMPIAARAGVEMMQEQLQSMTPEQREMVEKTQGIGQMAGLVAVPIMSFVTLWVAGAVLLLLNRFFGGVGNYGQMLSVCAYASLPGILKLAVTTPVILAKETVHIYTGPAVLLSEEVLQTFTGRLIAGMDFFSLWQVGLTAMGLAMVGKIGRGRAFAGVLILWLLWITATAAVAGLGNAFRPGG